MTSTHRKFEEPKLVVATHNPGKAREIADLLAPFGLDVLSARDLDLAEPEETGTTYKANAALKAHAAAASVQLPALADDSGLSVTALEGAPGIYSARWAGQPRDFDAAMQRVEDALQEKHRAGITDRSAHFVCALTLAWPDGYEETFEGRVPGTLIWPPRGDLGFGYDPMFLPTGQDRTFGEIDPADKHAMSHRAVAFRQLIDACFR